MTTLGFPPVMPANGASPSLIQNTAMCLESVATVRQEAEELMPEKGDLVSLMNLLLLSTPNQQRQHQLELETKSLDKTVRNWLEQQISWHQEASPLHRHPHLRHPLLNRGLFVDLTSMSVTAEPLKMLG